MPSVKWITVALGLFLLIAPLSGCDDDEPVGQTTAGGAGGTGGAGGGAGGAGGEGPTPVCTEPVDVPCSDQVLLEMNLLQTEVAPGGFTNTADGAGWQTLADAQAGGAFNPDPDSYVYGRFTADGLQKIDLADESSLESMDWDIAFRRYVIRLNSSHSGPSCVTGARVPPAVGVYEDILTVPEGLTFNSDEYFTSSCEIIPDGSGLPGSPATVLSGYWSYPGCVQMTDNVYVIALADGRHVKLQVLAYYDQPSQDVCDATDAAPAGAESALVLLRWAYLPAI